MIKSLLHFFYGCLLPVFLAGIGFLGSGDVYGVDIINEQLRNGILPDGWSQSSVTFETSADGYAKFNASSSELVSPLIDLSAYTNVELIFDVAKFGNGDNGPITVEFSNDRGSTWVAQSFDSPTPTSSTYETSGPTSITVTGANIKFRFIRSSSSSQKRVRDVILSGDLNPTNFPEPTNHPTNFQCTTNGSSEIDLSWTDATGAQVPDGYLLLWSEVGFSDITDPTDGTFVPDGANAANITQGTQYFAVTGLTQNTDYYFKIIPYTNTGTNVDYKTDGTVAQTACVTELGPCGFETFDNSNATGSYSNDSFVGENGVTWSYVESRDANGDGNGSGIDLPAIMLRRSSDNSKITSSTVTGGMGDFSVKLYKGFTGEGNRQVELFVNGVSWGTSTPFDDNYEHIFTVNGINIAEDLIIEIRNVTSEQVIIDDIKWTCYSGCTPTQTITDFYPIEGPAETLVSIIGTGFAGAGAVKFGGISTANFTVENDTLIIAEVPENGLSGKIAVTVEGCDRQSANDFDVLKNNGQCGIGGSGASYATDLFISEVYDASSGSLSYVEVFNGTAGNVILSNYLINIYTGASYDYPMSGTLNSGETYILRIGSGSSICPDFSVNDDQPSASGFNKNDDISLIKSGNLIDIAVTPNQTGYSISRNDDISSPSATFISSEWTISDQENCNNLSVPPYVPNSDNITINSQPADVDCNTITFSVDASSPGSTGSVPATYTWRYIAPGDDTWNLVSSLNGTNGLTVTGSNTATITITGNTGPLKDYQFYVDMGSGGTGECRKFSHAAQYTFETKAFYRAKADGNWSEPNIWEMSDTENGTYISVCQYPTDRSSDKVIIPGGFLVNLDVEISLDWLVIESGATLDLAENEKLTILDGNSTGADLVLEGTLIDNGNTQNGIKFEDDTPTWTMGSNGTLIKTNTSGASDYRDAYEGGISNIPTTSTWIYRYTGIGDLSFANSTNSVPMYYPNLILENANTGIYSSGINQNINLSTFTMTGSQPLVIKGNFDVGGSGIGNVNFSNINNGSTPVLVKGELIVKAGSTLRNTGTNAPSEGVGFEVEGDMNIEGTLDLSAGTGVNVGILKLSGSQDMIGVGNGITKMNHLIIDKDPGYNLLSELNFEIYENATFTEGILELDNTSITFHPSATTTGASNSSFVDGKVIKTGNSEEFTFPIGDVKGDTAFWYQPARIFGYTGSTKIEAQYFAEAHPHAGAYYDGESNTPGDNQEIGNCDYWTVIKNSGVDVKLALKYTNADTAYCNVVGEPAYVRIYSFNTVSNVWDEVSSGNVNDEIESAVHIATDITGGNYGDFAFGTVTQSNLNVLPISLLAFTAEAKENMVQTRWTTASETNNAFFTVERSADAKFFEPIGRVDGAGTSHVPKSYTFDDRAPLSGISYYRLKQTDFDGKSTYSEVRSVEFFNTGKFTLDLAYRSGDALHLAFSAEAPYIAVEIFDVFGQRVFGAVVANDTGRAVVRPAVSRGVYVVRISHNGLMASRKFFW